MTLFNFKTSQLHETHYVLSPFQILHSSIYSPYFCALYLNPYLLAIILHKSLLFYRSLSSYVLPYLSSLISSHSWSKDRSFVTWFYFPKMFLTVITILNLPFHSKHLRSHFLPIPLWLTLQVNNIYSFFKKEMKFSQNIRLITISILREITDASERAPLILLFHDIPEDDYYY
jgi:hypothetical protein